MDENDLYIELLLDQLRILGPRYLIMKAMYAENEKERKYYNELYKMWYENNEKKIKEI